MSYDVDHSGEGSRRRPILDRRRVMSPLGIQTGRGCVTVTALAVLASLCCARSVSPAVEEPASRMPPSGLPGQASASDSRPARHRSPVAEPARDDLDGSMLTVQEAGVLSPGVFELGLLVDNYDRDPLGIDVVDGGVAWRVGVVRPLELHFGYQLTRSVSSPGTHPVPPPPLDIVVLDGRVPSDPYRAMYWPMPYLAHHTARVDDMVSGEYSFGAKVRLFGQRGVRPAVAVSSQLTLPSSTAAYELSKGSGSGGLDAGFHVAASWRHERLRVSANLGMSLTGELRRGDRLIVVGHEVSLLERDIRRPKFLHSGLGVGFRVWGGLWALAEVSGWTPFGEHTPMQSESGASDALGGLQLRVRNLSLGVGIRWHLYPPPDGMTLSTGPLAGAADLTRVSEAERARFLDSLGADSQRPGANMVVLGLPADAPLPDGARLVARDYETSTRGNVGVAIRLSVRVGK
jgi:hypothetical protein